MLNGGSMAIDVAASELVLNLGGISPATVTITYLKISLSAHGGVMKRLNMLTYYLYAALFPGCMPCPEP
jgi:hypothetical protein